jgi:hypothetical protein
MDNFGRTVTAALLAAAIGASMPVGSTAGPLPINATMTEAYGGGVVQARWDSYRHRGWGPAAPIDGAIIGGPIAANAFGPYGYGYPYYPNYQYYGYWPYFGGYYPTTFHWGYRR